MSVSVLFCFQQTLARAPLVNVDRQSTAFVVIPVAFKSTTGQAVWESVCQHPWSKPGAFRSTRVNTGESPMIVQEQTCVERARVDLVPTKPARACARTHARTHARMHARTHERTHARTHERTHARTHAHTHTVRCKRLKTFSWDTFCGHHTQGICMKKTCRLDWLNLRHLPNQRQSEPYVTTY